MTLFRLDASILPPTSASRALGEPLGLDEVAESAARGGGRKDAGVQAEEGHARLQSKQSDYVKQSDFSKGSTVG